MHHPAKEQVGLAKIAAGGDAALPVEPAVSTADNLAHDPQPDGYRKASASIIDRFGGKPANAIDGKTTVLPPSPMNRRTSLRIEVADGLAGDRLRS